MFTCMLNRPLSSLCLSLFGPSGPWAHPVQTIQKLDSCRTWVGFRLKNFIYLNSSWVPLKNTLATYSFLNYYLNLHFCFSLHCMCRSHFSASSSSWIILRNCGYRFSKMLQKLMTKGLLNEN